jgi:elongation factor 1-gamma
VYPFKLVADAAFRAPFPNVMRWFDTCVNQHNFQQVIGKVVLCTTELTSNGEPIVTPTATSKKDKKKDKKKGQLDPKDYPKKEKAVKKEKVKQEPKKKEEKKEEKTEEPPKPKKAEHPFKIMDRESPSTFVMDTWKKTYSNCETYEAAMTEFWETFDSSGWSIFRGDYMYDDDNSVLFMTSNLIAGFIQRTEEIRKWLFGTMTIRGTAGKGTMPITAYFIIRGDSIDPLVKCNDDAEFYKWTKMEIPASDADKKLLFDYWTSDTTLEGQPVLDSRCYK